ncbi:MAG TPA: CcoQ/FixQ family Cbb3-type cytochrome c oxidase assembly chaperone [Deltaproteobacteria bacterium]|jgi:cbb3-type cytochrome oxidase subunit 3|nr:CcoQ/FixQ family Cbb3-type cytochrome c oxidase assembly chaperone [Deltaproteobacteria bacterium]
MSFSAWAYFLFTVLLGAVFAGIIVHYYSRKRRETVEAPKYRMLSDDADPPGVHGKERRR